MNKRLLTGLVMGALSAAALLRADDVLPASAFAFPTAQEGASARAIGLGSTYVGIDEGSTALFWNPAGLGGLQAVELGLHHEQSLLQSTQDIAVVGVPLGHGNGLGVALNFEDNGSFQGRDASGNPAGTYSANGYGAALGWGLHGPAGLSFGLGVKANRMTLADTTVDAVAGDAGLLWSMDPALSLGVAYTNFGADVQGRQLAQGLRVGLSSYVGKCQDFQWLFALSGEALTHGDSSIHLGVEHTAYKALALRAGYGFRVPSPDPDATGLMGWSFGAGILVDRFNVDYAFVPLGDLGNQQRLSLTYSFGDRCLTPTASPTPVRTPIATASPTPTPSPVALAPAPTPDGSRSYVVKKDDTLWDIAGKDSVRGDSAQWPLIFDANTDQILDPDVIYPGQRLEYKRYYTENEIDAAEETAGRTPPYKK